MSASRLPAELTHRQARACLQRIVQTWPQAPQALRVDAADLVRFDSAALAVLLALRRAAERQGQTLQILNLPQGMLDLAQVYGMADLLTSPVQAPASGG